MTVDRSRLPVPGKTPPFHFPAVERFQVVQEVPERVEVRLVLRPGWDEASRVRLDAELRKVLGPAVTIAGTDMSRRSRSGTVPAKATQVRMVMTFAGGNNYKLAGVDDISLVLA